MTDAHPPTIPPLLQKQAHDELVDSLLLSASPPRVVVPQIRLMAGNEHNSEYYGDDDYDETETQAGHDLESTHPPMGHSGVGHNNAMPSSGGDGRAYAQPIQGYRDQGANQPGTGGYNYYPTYPSGGLPYAR